MRRQGKITKWNDERGYGFITSKESDSVFFHIASLPRSDRKPSVNEVVSYTPAFDSQGRAQAKDVRFVLGSSTVPPKSERPRIRVSVQIVFALSFLIALAGLVVMGWLELSWLVLYYAASVITFGSYSRDKKAAGIGGWRTPESTLHLMSLLGGWPGALIAQVRLRHKTRKVSFLVVYWLTVIINCSALGMIVKEGVAPVKLLLGDGIW